MHDGVCQHLTGISLFCRSLQQKLTDRSAPEAAAAERITGLINEGIEQTRLVTRGLSPVGDDPGGLLPALHELAGGVQDAGGPECRVECPAPPAIPDRATATHLYRIAQEAVQNAIRHAHPTTILIRLTAGAGTLVLSVTDDGSGIPAHRPRKGLGLEIMAHRAHSIGATLDVRHGDARGTVVTCTLSRPAQA